MLSVSRARCGPSSTSFKPDASTLAVAEIDVDLSAVETGQSITAMWRGKPVFIRNRTEAEIEAARETSLDDLPDQMARNEKPAGRHICR